MCGIAGLVSTRENPVEEDALVHMLQRISHRGPDSQGTFVRPYVGLGNRRLSIIDLPTGDQPISNEAGTVWVVFNGEIYNYLELREMLSARGHHLGTSGDTEVLVHLYEDYGSELLNHLRGMFAFAIWDEQQRQLLLARDRIGIKPLYYTSIPGYFAFASELKVLTLLPGFDREVDVLALANYLQLQYVPSPKSIFRSARKLPPGHILTLRDGQIKISPYWKLESFVPPRDLTPEEAREGLRNRLLDAVRAEMVSDVPIGAFLSGGLDSSSVVAAMCQASGDVRTFTISFADDHFDEASDARLVADHCHTQHQESVVRMQPSQVLAELVLQMDEPFADPSMIPTFYVSQEARSQVKVVLSGDGGDELFAGYERYQSALRVERRLAPINRVPIAARQPVARFLGQISPFGKRTLALLEKPPWKRYSTWQNQAFSINDVSDILNIDLSLTLVDQLTSNPYPEYAQFVFDPTCDLDIVSRMQHLDFVTYMVDDILTKVDRMSMANSLEVRVPLLDHRLVEYVVGLPSAMKLHNGSSKWILREVMAELLPLSIVWSKGKTGFSPSLGYWFDDSLVSQAEDLLTPDAIRRRGFFNTEYIQTLFQQSNRLRLWTVFLFELWCQAYLDGEHN